MYGRPRLVLENKGKVGKNFPQVWKNKQDFGKMIW